MNNENLIWIDMEMTGLEPNTDKVLEICAIVTDKDLNILEILDSVAIHQSDDVLNNMIPWCIETHGKSGLTDRCRNSTVALEQAEQMVIDFMAKWVPKGVSPLCGNSVSQDRRFMFVHMPALEKYFSYRTIDVSTIKELSKRWAGMNYNKKNAHLAKDDILESIGELKYYREHAFKI